MTTRKASRLLAEEEDEEEIGGGGMEMTSPVRTIRPSLFESAETSEWGED